jgi:uncharacterized protein YqgV (UPF0045/DUF77 family)
MKHPVHIGIQIVPITQQPNVYAIIDRALDVIKSSGVDHRVGALETVMQGEYDELMTITKRALDICLEAGADEIAVTMKVHAKKANAVKWEDKGV